MVKSLGLAPGDSFSPHPLPTSLQFFAYPRQTPSLTRLPACLFISPPGKGKETAATQASKIAKLFFATCTFREDDVLNDLESLKDGEPDKENATSESKVRF